MTIVQNKLQIAANLKPVQFADLQGWVEDDHRAALETFRLSCGEILAVGQAFKRGALFGGQRIDWTAICEASLHADNGREFFEENFLPFLVRDSDRPEGLFTGYFEPEALGSRTPTPEYNVPIYAKPSDLVALDIVGQQVTGLKYGRYEGKVAKSYLTRKEIEQGGLSGRGLEIVWLKDWADAFFVQVQGSGRVILEDGTAIRLAYAAKTGLPYTGIGGVLIDRGILTPQTNSMQAIRSWMSSHREAARELMWLNKSFVFFREIEIADPKMGALGAQQVSLTPERSLAVDRSIWMFGTPLWIDTKLPMEAGGAPFRRLMVAQDTGSAIKGAARGDVYWGWGARAAQIAGHMKSAGTMTVLLPTPVVKSLGL